MRCEEIIKLRVAPDTCEIVFHVRGRHDKCLDFFISPSAVCTEFIREADISAWALATPETDVPAALKQRDPPDTIQYMLAIDGTIEWEFALEGGSACSQNRIARPAANQDIAVVLFHGYKADGRMIHKPAEQAGVHRFKCFSS